MVGAMRKTETDAPSAVAWKRCAAAIARREAERVQMATAPEIAAAIRHKLDPLAARLEALEQQIQAMEAKWVGERLEWPLPTKGRTA